MSTFLSTIATGGSARIEVGGTTIELAAGDRSLVVGLVDATEAWRSLDARAESVAEPPADA